MHSLKRKVIIAMVLVLGLIMFTACSVSVEHSETVIPAKSESAAASKPVESVASSAPATASSVAAQVIDQDFHISNKTGVTIFEMNISPSEEDVWGPDVLDGERIKDGEGATVHFSHEATAQYWDLRIKDVNGDGIYFYDLDLFEISELTLTIEDGVGVATAGD